HIQLRITMNLVVTLCIITVVHSSERSTLEPNDSQSTTSIYSTENKMNYSDSNTTTSDYSTESALKSDDTKTREKFNKSSASSEFVMKTKHTTKSINPRNWPGYFIYI
ncbi:unnamed protein product, partial [Meganyctiphanes norvegica]